MIADEPHSDGLLAALHSHPSPPLILLDDPTRGLHGEDIQRMIGFMRRCAKDGDLFVVATHRAQLRSAAGLLLELPGPSPASAQTEAPPDHSSR